MPKLSTASALATLMLIAGANTYAVDEAPVTAQPQATASASAEPTLYGAAVNAARLIAADDEPGQWMAVGRDYGEQRFSPLDQVNTETVNDLGLLWSADIDTSRGQESTPVVVDGALYVTTAWSHVKAYDVRTGAPLWAYDPGVAPAKGVDACCDVVNRGVAVCRHHRRPPHRIRFTNRARAVERHDCRCRQALHDYGCPTYSKRPSDNR